MNVIVSLLFFILSIPLAIKFIPYFTVRQLRKRNKKFVIRKLASIIQETCEFILDSPFKDKELNKDNLVITTKKTDLRNYKFISLSNIDVFNKISPPLIQLTIIDYFKHSTAEESFKILKNERERLKDLRKKLENIIDAHSLHLDEKYIVMVSELCLDIRQFDIKFKTNYALDDLIESGKIERFAVFGLGELAKIYEKTIILLRDIIDKKYFDVKLELPEN